MERKTVLGIAIALGALAGGSIVALASSDLSQAAAAAQRVDMPAVSAHGDLNPPPAEARLDASLAAYVEVDGRHFNVYVGATRDDLWSVAVPAPD